MGKKDLCSNKWDLPYIIDLTLIYPLGMLIKIQIIFRSTSRKVKVICFYDCKHISLSSRWVCSDKILVLSLIKVRSIVHCSLFIIQMKQMSYINSGLSTWIAISE